MDPPVILPPSIDDVPPPGVAIAVELDKLLMVQLRDGRKILGTLRSFDQFSNLLLECESWADDLTDGRFVVARRAPWRWGFCREASMPASEQPCCGHEPLAAPLFCLLGRVLTMAAILHVRHGRFGVSHGLVSCAWC